MVEVLADTVIRTAPVRAQTAVEMLTSIAGGRLLEGRRAISAAAAEQVATMIVGVGQLMVDEPALAEVDLNPIIITGDRAVAVDALVVTAPALG